jgi:hypothetical protein
LIVDQQTHTTAAHVIRIGILRDPTKALTSRGLTEAEIQEYLAGYDYNEQYGHKKDYN